MSRSDMKAGDYCVFTGRSTVTAGRRIRGKTNLQPHRIKYRPIKTG